MIMYKKDLTVAEINQITAWGYCIRTMWISPIEGWEYRPCIMGDKYPLAYKKTARAAYNFIKRRVETGLDESGEFHRHTHTAPIKPKQEKQARGGL